MRGAGIAVKLFARPRGEAGWDLRDPGQRRRALLHYHLVDHAILRHHWTNMDEVVPGVWRSNQPTHGRMKALKSQGIRTVISLRGDGGASFQMLERESCEALGLRLVTVALRSRRAPERAQVLKLLEAFRTAEKPVLIHCKSGADRSGFAAALYLIAHEGETVAEARRHLSWRYLHLKGSRAGVLGHILGLYAARLREGPIGIEEWFATEYDADAAQAGFGR
ncbi:MAG TPA: sulfur transferase domain-containing protein [Longimicrobium sp.]|nr:sulfur transferase domain-containing protein [Longimicrobium sp.]